MDSENPIPVQTRFCALLKDIDAVEVSRCVRLDASAAGECTEVWPEDEELPEATVLIGEPFYTVFGHYRPGSGKQGVEALCDCPSRPIAELIASLLEAAIGQAR